MLRQTDCPKLILMNICQPIARRTPKYAKCLHLLYLQKRMICNSSAAANKIHHSIAPLKYQPILWAIETCLIACVIVTALTVAHMRRSLRPHAKKSLMRLIIISKLIFQTLPNGWFQTDSQNKTPKPPPQTIIEREREREWGRINHEI